MPVQNGSRVKQGDLLFVLESLDLEAELERGRADTSSAGHELARVMSSQETSGDRLVAAESLARSQAALKGGESRQQRLHVLAPFAGTLSDIPPAIRPGLWVGDKQSLGLLVGDGGGIVADAWVTEEYLRFIHPGDAARFYPEDPTLSPQNGIVEHIDAVDTRVLAESYLLASHGGGIPVRMDGEGNAVPEYAVYRVRLRLESGLGAVPLRVVRGKARFNGDSRSVVVRAGSFVAGSLRRESGF